LKKLKILALIAILTCGMFQAFQVFAYTNEIKIINNSSILPDANTIAKPLGTDMPTSVTPWDDNDQISYNGEAKRSMLYSKGFFTGASEVALKITNELDDDFIVTLYKKGVVFNTKVGHRIVYGNSTCLFFNGDKLDSTAKYFFTFDAPCKFNGTLTRKEK